LQRYLTNSAFAKREKAMRARTFTGTFFMAAVLTSLLVVAGCSPLVTPTPSPTAVPVTPTPDWFKLEMTDVRTGQTFTVNDFSGKVVLLETMAEWCPNCEVEEKEVIKLHQLLGAPADLVSLSLDVDLHEDEASLKEYASTRGYDWYFAVAPLLVARALGNLYSAQYLNPPLAPMLFIDKEGAVHSLPYGFKSAEALRKTIEPYLLP
jgi:thiol-disulfide isomerase/thioredoxin